MSFRGLLRPGQGFKKFAILRKEGGLTKTGRPCAEKYEYHGCIFGIISQANPKTVEQWKQVGFPITHTIVVRGTQNRAKPTDVLELMEEPDCNCSLIPRRFLVHAHPHDPGELGHFLIYQVEERGDLM